MSTPETGWLSIHPIHHVWTLHLPHRQRFGKKRRTLTIRIGGRTKKAVRLSTTPPPAQWVRTKIKLKPQQKSFKIGPTIGILTVKGKNTSFLGNRKNFSDIIQTAQKKGGLVYVMTPEAIDWNSHSVRGYLFQEQPRKWLQATLPLPDVVYNRVPYRKHENEPMVRKTLDRLSHSPQLHLYNKHFFDKWDLFKTLQTVREVKPYLPETKTLTDFNDLKAVSDLYPVLYLKPIRGRAGKGIIKIEKTAKSVTVYYPSAHGVRKRRYSSLRKGWPKIASFVSRQAYIIQRAVPLARYQNRTFDVRVLIQRNGSGQWQVTGTGIRVAGKNSITTHVPRGGFIASPEKVFRAAFPTLSSEHIMQRIKKAALHITEGLSQKNPELGELSMDMGIDPRGDLWFFEANAKPMKFDEPLIRKQSLYRIVEYAHYLAGFRLPERREQHANTGD